jgi:hypothetical protein
VGPAGPAGTFGSETLKSGETLMGQWSFLGTEEFTSVSYPIKLAAAIGSGDIAVLDEAEAETTNCPGSVTEPDAAPGKLCLYSLQKAVSVSNFGLPFSSITGATLFLDEVEGAVYGTWAVTAP